MTNKGVLRSSNSILVGGSPLTQFLKILAPVDNSIPGRWVVKGTNDDDIVVIDSPTGTSAQPDIIGWIGFEKTPAEFQPLNRATAQAAGDIVAVHHGNCYLMAALSAVNGTKGELLTTGESGMLTALLTPGGGMLDAQTKAVAKLQESVDASTSVTFAVVKPLF